MSCTCPSCKPTRTGSLGFASCLSSRPPSPSSAAGSSRGCWPSRRRRSGSRCGCWPRRRVSRRRRSSPTRSSVTTATSRCCGRSPTEPRSSRSTTSTCPPSTCDALAEAGVAVRPGPEALVHAQDKAVMRERLTALGVPCPRYAVVTSVTDVEAFGLAVRAQGHPWRVRRSRGVDGPRPPRGRGGVRDRDGDRRPGARRGARRLPSRAGRAGGPIAERPGRGVPGRRQHPARRHLSRGRGAGARTSTRSWPRTHSRSR